MLEEIQRSRPPAAAGSMLPPDSLGETRNGEGDGGGLGPARAAAARRTRRHVAIARTLRIVLIVVAVTTVAFVVIWPQIQPRMDRLRIGMAALEKLDADGEGLVKARLTGSDDQGQPYIITADFVRQVEGEPGILGLTRPRGEIEMEDGTKTVITAADGRFHQDARLLNLDGGVVLVTGDGSRYETPAADFDLAAGTASGTDPVQGQGPFGTVSGEGFHATGFGQTIFIDGRSTLTVAGTAQEKPS